MYSFLYDEETVSEFRKLFNQWDDVEYLESFFSEHIDDLQSGFWGIISVEYAVLRTIEEAKNLEKKLIEVARMGQKDRYSTLSSLFKPLHDKTTTIEEFEFNKVKGRERKSWLRIYLKIILIY